MLKQPHKHSWFSYLFTATVAVSLGVVGAFLLVWGIDRIPNVLADKYSYPEDKSGDLIKDNNILVANGYQQVDATKEIPEINSRAFLVADIETGEVILSHNPDQVLPMASLTKLMTALITVETFDELELVRVTQGAVDTFGESGSLVAGQRLPVSEMIYPLLIESSNDAAEVLARHVGRDVFLTQMNAKAEILGLNDTYFADPSGISPNNISNTEDLLDLLSYVYKYKRNLLEITKLHDRSFKSFRWVNVNKLADNEYFIGGKNGHTSAAKNTFAGIFSLPLSETTNTNVAIILLGSDSQVGDVNNIIDFLIDKPNTQATTSLVFVGDIMLDRGVRQSVERRGVGYDYIFHRVPFLARADISFANLEGPVSDKGVDKNNLYSFRMDPASVQALTNAGLDVLSIANNHMGDWGMEAFLDTLSRLSRAGLVYVGGGVNKTEAESVKVISKNNTSFGFVAFSDVGPNSLAATDNLGGIVIASEQSVARVVSEAARQVDVLIASFHFGQEYKSEPTERQKMFARLAIDNGAKIVVGHHPHVIAPIEYYKDGLIAYSLGNFIFDQYFSVETMTGGVLSVEMLGRDFVKVSTSTVSLSSDFVPELSY